MTDARTARDFNRARDSIAPRDSSTATPLVSIGMPVLNCERTIARAISSIVGQTFGDWELLVIDDGSTDNTRAVAKSFRDPRIVVTGGGNRGLPERLNECVSRARGRFFARMDGDDVAYPQRLQCQLDYLRSHDDVDLVAGWMVVFRGEGTAFGTRRTPLAHEALCAHPWSGISMAHPTWMGRIEWFQRNGYRTDAAGMEDQELLLRTCTSSRFATLPQVVLGYRENSLSLAKSLRARREMGRMMLRHGWERGNFATSALGLLGLAAKGLIDTVAIGSGLNYRLLRHRAPAMLPDEAKEWRTVWEQTGRVRVEIAQMREAACLLLQQ